jgi:hypothetical protein
VEDQLFNCSHIESNEMRHATREATPATMMAPLASLLPDPVGLDSSPTACAKAADVNIAAMPVNTSWTCVQLKQRL